MPNLRLLAPVVDEVELVLFETPTQNNLPTCDEIRDMASLASDCHLTFNVHFPPDVFFSDPSRHNRQQYRDIILRYYERTLPLEPTLYILHLDSRHADGKKETNQQVWIKRMRDSLEKLALQGVDLGRLAVENLEYPLERIANLAEEAKMLLCLDIGHLLLYEHPLGQQLDCFLERSSMLHLHGVLNGVDHLGLSHIPGKEWEEICQGLESFQGGLTLELFSWRDLVCSLQRLKRFAGY